MIVSPYTAVIATPGLDPGEAIQERRALYDRWIASSHGLFDPGVARNDG